MNRIFKKGRSGIHVMFTVCSGHETLYGKPGSFCRAAVLAATVGTSGFAAPALSADYVIDNSYQADRYAGIVKPS